MFETSIDENSLRLAKVKEETLRRYTEYSRLSHYMACDAPIATLCLNRKLEKTLSDHGIERIYDLLDMDLGKVEWLDERTRGDLASRLDEFFTMF